jgi:phosphate:Na+ symporter
VAIGLYSTFFNIFNTAILFPFVGVFERVLLQVGKDVSDDFEDFSTPRHLNPNYAKDPAQALPAIQRETARYLDAAVLFLDIARQHPNAPDDSVEHSEAIDVLSREIRTYTAGLFDPNMPHDRADLIASLIEEEDFSASLGEALYQIARRVERHPFSDPGRKLVNEMLELLAQEMSIIVPGVAKGGAPALADHEARMKALADLRERTIKMGSELPWEDRGAILALLGSAERAFNLIDRIHEERLSVPRIVTVKETGEKTVPGGFGQAAAVPAE